MNDHIYLAHHGIKGMKWGVRRFQNADGSLTSAGKRRYDDKSESSRDRFWTDERKKKAKKIAIGTAVVASAVLVAYGSYKISKLPNETVGAGKSSVAKLLDSSRSNRVGRDAGRIDIDMVRRVNAHNTDETGEINCAHTSMAYVLNSVIGKNVTAKGFNGVDEVSGLYRPGRNVKIFDQVFSGVNHIVPPDSQTRWGIAKPTISETVDRIPKGSTGILFVNAFGGGHFMNYERNADGVLTLIDCQQHDLADQVIKAGSPVYNNLADVFRVNEILDCSNATLRDGADKVLRYCVEG